MPRLLVLALLCLCPATLVADDEAGFVPLFNGRDFDGWKKAGGSASYRIEGDHVVGEVDPASKSNTFLCTEKNYGNFVLELDVKLDIPGDSGTQVRSHSAATKDGGTRVFGYQVEIDPSDRAWSGGLYDEGRRGWLYDLKGHPEAQKAFKKTDWNTYRIEAIGPHIRTWLNGVPCADVLDTMDLDGFIALQVHVGKEGRMRWKNVRVKDLGTNAWKPMFDGKSLAGWTPTGGGKWTVEKGELHGSNTTAEPRHGHLFAEGMVGDFAMKLKYESIKGNSGVYFRVEEGGSLGVQGFQAEIDPSNDVGGLYETEGRGWVVQPRPEDVKKWIKPKGWNELSLVALGDRVAVFVNGHKSAEIVDPKGRKSGRIALQLHGGQDVDVRFKEIEFLKIGAMP